MYVRIKYVSIAHLLAELLNAAAAYISTTVVGEIWVDLGPML
jgi:hypothetical protein